MSDTASSTSGGRIGPIRLTPGIPASEVFLFLFVTGIAVVFVSFLSLMQPFVLTEIVHVPVKMQGRLSGELMTVQQIMMLLFVSIAGAMADRVGRKAMLVFALVGFAISAALYPLASSIIALFLIRIFYGLASTGHTAGGPTKFFDYPTNDSRGKFMALVMVFYAVLQITLVGAIGSRLPGWLQASGLSIAEAGSRALWIAAAVAFVTALIAFFFLKRDVPTRQQQEAAAPRGYRAMFRGFREVIAYARTNRRFGMLLVTSFVIRTDVSVLQSFMALWITIQGGKQGLTTLAAVKIAGTVAAIISGMNLIVPPILGYLLDRTSRLAIYLVSVGFVGVVFLCAPMVKDVTGWSIYILAAFIGLAEGSQTISQQALFGQEAPAHLRGTAYGLLAFFGTLSVVVTSFLAGYLFDRLGPTAPFLFTGILHILFTLLAVIILVAGVGRARRARTA
jgi:MFS family permease